MRFKVLSCILALGIFVQGSSVYAEFSKLEYQITWHDEYVEIAGAGSEVSEEMSISLFDENGDILYADQANTGENNEFLFKANVGEKNIAKIVFGGDKRESTLMDFFKKAEDVIYFSKNGEDEADGASSSPVMNLSRAIELANEQVYCLGEAVVGGEIDMLGKNITVTGDILDFTSEVNFNGNVYFENISLGDYIKINATGNVIFGENVEFLENAEITAENIITDSEIRGTVIAQNVIFQNCVSKDNVTVNADCVVFSGKGGKVVLKEDGVYPEPEGGRAYSIDGGEYKVNPEKITNGMHNVAYDYDFNLHSLKIEENDNGYLLKISASAYNLLGSKEKTNPVICVAAFSDGKLLEVKSENAGNAGAVYKEIQIGKSALDELDIKVYMLDSFERIRPLANVLIGDNSENNVFYASPSGSVDATGEFSDPMTIEAAVKKAKNTAGKSKIILRGGEYILSEALDLSGCADIEILAFNNETPVITTAEKIEFSAFEALTDETVKSRIIDESAKDKILVADVTKLSDYGAIYRYELQYGSPAAPVLSVDGEKLTLARYPNKENGEERFLTIVSSTNKPLTSGSTTENFSFFVNEEEAKEHMASWVGNNELHMFGYMSSHWADAIFKGSIEEYNSEFRFVSDYPWRYSAPKSGGRIFFANLLEELDSPGEWYLDRSTGKLYLYPTSQMNDESTLAFTASRFDAFTVKNAANIKINGLKIQDCGGNGVEITNSNNIEVSDCEFTNTLSGAISVSGENCIVKNNYIHNVSMNGISVSGGDAEYLVKGGNIVENNLVTDYAEDRKCYYSGIGVSGVGNTVSGNTIKNAPHMALSMGGQMNVVEYNYVTDVCLETADSGALYAGGSFACPGNKIRYNYFENVTNRIGQGYTNNCVYLDDLFSSAEVYGNVFYNCQRAALFGGGRENTFVNNTMVECDASLTIDARGTWGGSWTTAVETRLTALEENFPYYQNETWKNAFPNLYNIKEDHPELPMYNTVKNNVLYNSPEYLVSEYAVENGSVEESYTVTSADAFLDFENEIFAPRIDGEIYQNLPGFVAAEFDKIGCRIECMKNAEEN